MFNIHIFYKRIFETSRALVLLILIMLFRFRESVFLNRIYVFLPFKFF
ncbi:hypothetical protein JCM19297_2454 [Nonlabens ulvanivorans]|nr:hypothetical protein JCM19297_2454 [Nonlabens ulvanivorans]